jgi:hypothetical protein
VVAAILESSRTCFSLSVKLLASLLPYTLCSCRGEPSSGQTHLSNLWNVCGMQTSIPASLLPPDVLWEQALARIIDLSHFAGLFIGKYALGRAPTCRSLAGHTYLGQVFLPARPLPAIRTWSWQSRGASVLVPIPRPRGRSLFCPYRLRSRSLKPMASGSTRVLCVELQGLHPGSLGEIINRLVRLILLRGDPSHLTRYITRLRRVMLAMISSTSYSSSASKSPAFRRTFSKSWAR